MKVILSQDVTHLGAVGDIVQVRRGYFRNFLHPRGLAMEANERRVRRFEHEKRIIDRKIAKLRVGAEARAVKLNDLGLTVAKAVGENDKLFGSVTPMEIESMLRAEGFDVSRRQIHMEGPIKSTGVFPIHIKLHRDVTATIKIYVVAKQ